MMPALINTSPGGNLAATEGAAFTGVLATFTDPAPELSSNYSATVFVISNRN